MAFSATLRRFGVVTSGVALSVVAMSGVASACPSGGTSSHANERSSSTTTTHATSAHSNSKSNNSKAHTAAGSSTAGTHSTTGTAGTSGDASSPQPVSKADSNTGGANGQCPGGPYCSTRDGSPSLNGNGGGTATGKPCAGCVGKADNKNPKGQMPGGSDNNAGYECDRNHGIGRGNPAHTGCTTATTPVVVPVTTCPEGQSMVDGVCADDAQACPAGAEMLDGTCVLGEGFTRNPGTPVAGTVASGDVPATVLGEQFSRVPAATSLPFTGAPTGELLLLAAGALAAGGGLALAGRRRREV